MLCYSFVHTSLCTNRSACTHNMETDIHTGLETDVHTKWKQVFIQACIYQNEHIQVCKQGFIQVCTYITY